ncbi:MAG: TetR/AcrR family transcriptional regulator [Planctomycetota bacterium]
MATDVIPADASRTRKQREWQRRETLILDVARRRLSESGMAGLNMDQIAAEIEYSKGTVYQHFRSKDDLLMGLAAAATDSRVALFSKAATLPGRSRERLTAIGVSARLFIERYPDHFRVEQILELTQIRDKTDPERQRRLAAAESRCMAIFAGVGRDGVAAGDLVLPENFSAENVAFGLWSLCMGGFTLVMSRPLEELGVIDPPGSIFRNYHAYLDGLGWRPLSGEFDYGETTARAEALLAERPET